MAPGFCGILLFIFLLLRFILFVQLSDGSYLQVNWSLSLSNSWWEYATSSSSQQAEDALSQGMEQLQQSLAETLAGSLGPSGSSGNVANYMGQMAMAMGKLGTLENFLRQVHTCLLMLYEGFWKLLLTCNVLRDTHCCLFSSG